MPTAIRRRGNDRVMLGKSKPVKPVVKARRKLGERITGDCTLTVKAYDQTRSEWRETWHGVVTSADSATSSDTYALIFVQRRDDKPDAVKLAPVGPSGAFIHVGHSGWFDLPAGVVAHGILPSSLPADVRASLDAWLAKRKHTACRLLDKAAQDYELTRVKADTGVVTAAEVAAVNRGDHRA